MKIAQLNTYDIIGGAARASYRLHQGMCQLGHDSTLFVRYKHSDDPTVYPVSTPELDARADALEWFIIQRRYIGENRTPLSNSYFSFGYPGFDVSHLAGVAQADVINMHWVAAYQSPTTLHKLLALGKPVVWTFHDMWALSGGCHYAATCDGYQHDCSGCPQLNDNPLELPAVMLADKIDLLSHFDNLTIVAASQWMAECVRRSKLFRRCRVEVIPYSLENDLFVSPPKAEAKQRVGIAPDTVTFVTASVTEKRKGFPDLLNALERCLENAQFKALVEQQKFKLIFYGQEIDALKTFKLPYVHLGWRSSDAELIEAYSAGDAVILPSQQDNMPLTMLEAMSCGVPVIAFQTGGMQDVIEDGITGRLVPLGDYQRLTEVLLECALNPDQCRQMGEQSRRVIESRFTMPTESKHYAALYDDLLKQRRSVGMGVSTETEPSSAAVDSATAHLARFDQSFGPHMERIFPQLMGKATQMVLDGRQKEADEKLQRVQMQLEQKNKDLRQKLEQAQGEIAAMQTSKFWKLRAAWFKVKGLLGASN